ncbi:hypothetical protein B0H17DRAFT_1049975 [Mycena rosella]|uniref:Uncharacterized protein n=1 Tax=Mycena rosella TaxID=1033263 RepID=A0AAD7DU62_MYCRO|nr:hypothetical protein B0H17DRAFT_1049975 [Mycena rosella]
MGSDNQPLLVDAPPSTDVDNGQLQHYCARCSSQLESHQDNKESQPWTMRHSLIIVAIILSSVIFIFSVVEMSTGRVFRGPSILQIFVVIWTDMTITFLALLLYMGRRRQAGRRKLGRTVAQVRVLCALASSWTIFMTIMMALNPRACGWYSNDVVCGLFTTIHVFTWFLIITLFWAAYATYRRAVTIHGTNMVPLPTTPMVSAWRLSNIADGEGAIKI